MIEPVVRKLYLKLLLFDIFLLLYWPVILIRDWAFHFPLTFTYISKFLSFVNLNGRGADGPALVLSIVILGLTAGFDLWIHLLLIHVNPYSVLLILRWPVQNVSLSASFSQLSKLSLTPMSRTQCFCLGTWYYQTNDLPTDLLAS